MYFRSTDKLNDFDQNRAISGSGIKSQVLDLKTSPILSPLKRGLKLLGRFRIDQSQNAKNWYTVVDFKLLALLFTKSRICGSTFARP